MPENRGDEVRVREEFGLRTDRLWLDWVAEHGTDGGTMMMLPIMLADEEIVELRERDERAMRTIRAFTQAQLASAAGAWLDQRAGGVVRLLLAHPDPAEQDATQAIVDEHGGTVELVEHSTHDLEQISTRLLDEVHASTDFGQAAMGWGTDVWANAVRLTLRGDLHPDIPEDLQAAAIAGSLIIEHPTEPAGWEAQHPDGVDDSAHPVPPDKPRPQWPGDDSDDYWNHWHRCVRYVAERCVGGPVEVAQQLAEDIGLTVRVIWPGSGHTQELRSGRATMYVNAHHIVRGISAE